MSVRGFLCNNAVMMILAFVAAMLLGGFPENPILTNGGIAMLSLMVMMSLSLTALQLKGLKVRSHGKAIRNAFILSFILSSGITILMSFLFQGELREGWIIEAAVPSAVSVVPFTYILKGDLEPTLVSSAVLYFIALGFTPLITLLFLGQPIDQLTLLEYVGVLILLPLAISRFMRRIEISQQNKTAVINLAFFVLIVAIAGPNRQVFFTNPVLLSGLIAVAIIRIFVVGLLYDWYLKRKGAPRKRRVPEVLFATYKNTGMAATLAIGLIGPAAAVPATVCTLVEISWLIFLSKYLFSTKSSLSEVGTSV